MSNKASSAWSRWWEQAVGILQISIKDMLQYRFAFLSSTLGTALSITVQMIFWMGVFELNQVQSVVGYSRQEMLSYILVAQIVNRLVHGSSTLWSYATDIRTGGLNTYLLRPMNYVWYRLGMLLGGRLVDTLSSAIPLSIVIYLFRGSLQISRLGAVAAVPMILAVFYLYYSIDSLIGCLAFWMENVSSIAYFKWVIFGFFAGRFFPIEIFPDWVARLLDYLPFPYLVYYPVQLITGQMADGWLVLYRLLIVIGWGIFFNLVRSWIWKQGMRRYAAMGG